MQRPKPFLFISLVLLLCFSACRALDCTLSNVTGYKVAYTIIVDQSGHGNFTTIQKAIDSIPDGNTQWIRIQIFSGKYREKVMIPKKKSCIFLEGAGSALTSIEWDDHMDTSSSVTFTSSAEYFVAKGITFKNTYNLPLQLDKINFTQAVAARINGDKSAFYHCAFVGIQDTLRDNQGRHYFSECYIEGAVDFIFGEASQSIYESCAISTNVGKYPLGINSGYITAQKRSSPQDPSGFVFKNCQIGGAGKTYLGRAWGPYSRVIIYNSVLSDVVIPDGWNAWDYGDHVENIMYVENNCSGPGANTTGRVPWLKKLNDSELGQFVDISYINQDGWLAKLPEVF